LLIAALLIAAFCVRRRKQGILRGENRSNIGEFQNPAYVGDPRLYFGPAQSSGPENVYEEPPPPYLAATNPIGVVLDVNKSNSQSNEGVYETPEGVYETPWPK
jgi:hypothetical protein